MNTFQIIAIGVLSCLIVRELWHVTRYRSDSLLRLLRLACWTGAICVVSWPGLSSRLANWTGIGRGADLILYVAALSQVAAIFYLVTRQITLERQIIDLVRLHAIEHAQMGAARETPRDPPQLPSAAESPL